MRVWFKRLLLAAAAAAAAASVAAVSLKLVYPPERVKAMALAKIQTSLGREVRIASASIGLRRIGLAGIEVSEVPDFKAGVFCSVRSARLSFRLAPLLLRRSLEVGEFSADGWSLRLQQSKPPASTKPASTPHRKPSSSPVSVSSVSAVARSSSSVARSSFTLDVSALSFTDGRVEVLGPSGGAQALLSGVSLEAADIRLDRAFPFSLKTDFETGAGPSLIKGTVLCRGKLDWAAGDAARASVEVRPMEVRVGEAEAELQGRLRGFQDPEADLELSVSPLNRTALRGSPGAASRLPADLRLPALKGALRVKRTGETLDVQELFVSGGDFSAALSAESRGDNWRLRASHLGWKGAKAVLSGEGSLASGKRKEPALDLRLTTERIPLAVVGSLLPALEEYKARGAVKADLSAKGPASAPALSGDLVLEGVGLTAAGQTFSGLSGKVSFTDRTVAGEVKGKLNEGELHLELEARDYRGLKPDYRLKGTLSVLDLAALPGKKTSGEPDQTGREDPSSGGRPSGGKGPSKTIATSGSFLIGSIRHPKFEAAESQLRWDLKGLTEDLSGLDGSASFRVGKGRLQELKSLGDGKPMMKLAFMPLMLLQRVAGLVKVPLFPAFDKATFESVTGDYVFKDGVMSIRESHLDSSVGYVAMDGSVDLGKESLDVHVLTRMLIKGIGGPVGFKVTGTFKEPRIRIDPAAIIRQPVVEKAVEQGKDLLKGLFKH